MSDISSRGRRTPHRDIVAVGTSAGGVEALQFLTSKLPANFDATILIAIHLSEGFPSTLDRILSRAGTLPAQFARDGDEVETGHIYIAAPERHLLLDGERIALGRGPRENNARPAIDPTIPTAGLCCESRVIGIVLSGMLGDGAAGLVALKQCGGITVVQEPADAAFSDMPKRAVQLAQPDHLLSLAAMPT